MGIPEVDRLRRAREARDLARRFAASAERHDREASFPHENFALLRAAGWPALSVPAAAGGWGAGLADAVSLLQLLAQGCGSTALAFAMHVQTLGTAAGRGWSAGAHEALCRDVVARAAWVNSCASEPELGSPSRGGLPRTLAVPAPGGWRIDGRKTFASLAPVLDWVIVPAALQGEEAGIGRFLVPAAALTVVETWDAMGMRATGSHDLVLEGVTVPEQALLYRETARAPGPLEARAGAWFTLCFSAVYLGVADAAVDEAARYALRRVPTALGRPIAQVEAVQRQVGEADLLLRAARSQLQGLAASWDRADEGERAGLGPEIVALKLHLAEAVVAAVDLSARVMGGASLQRGRMERSLRDVRAVLHHPPATDQGLALLGRLRLAAVEAEAT